VCDDRAFAGVTRDIIKEDSAFESDRGLLGNSQEDQKRFLKAVLDQQWAGIDEYTEVLLALPLAVILYASPLCAKAFCRWANSH
jgi:hypothetical protein